MNNKISIIVFILLGSFGVYIGLYLVEKEQEERYQKELLERELERSYQKNFPQDEVYSEIGIGEGEKLIEEIVAEPMGEEEVGETVMVIDKKEETKQESKELPDMFDMKVPFQSQSPLGTWGKIFRETCEEASVLLAYSYFRGPYLNARQFREELLKIVTWEKDFFGKYDHTNVEETAQILEKFYNFKNYKIIENPSVEDMKQYLSQGQLILAPFYGVGMNPHYSGIGPEYHFLLIKGYTNTTFITHDVGTKRGKNYHYKTEMLMERLHDYNQESVQNGAKKIIVVQNQ